jgi:hypothetical protein
MQPWASILSILSCLLTNPETSPNSWLGPTLHKLLSFRPVQSNMSCAAIIEEVSRIGILLFLASIWRTFSMRVVETAALRGRLLVFIKSYFVDWRELRPLLLWTLMHAASESENEQERSEFAFRLAVMMNKMNIESWEAMLGTVKGVLWSDSASQDTYDAVRSWVQIFLSPKTSTSGSVACFPARQKG